MDLIRLEVLKIPKILVLADDLTGANDTASAIHNLGIDTFTVIGVDCEKPESIAADCISVNTNSRNKPSRFAADAIHSAVSKYRSSRTVLVSKRIDSTLRGNLGSECDAVLDCMPGNAIAAIVPAFPKAGRVFLNGEVLVYGTPVSQTAVARDPVWPITVSSPEILFTRQSKRSSSRIPLESVRRGKDEIISQCSKAVENGCTYLFFEAETEEDISLIADGVVSLGRPFVAVDPGSFTAAAAARMLSLPPQNVLAVVGSINDITKAQVRYLIAHETVSCAVLDVSRLLESEQQYEAEITRASDELIGVQHDNRIKLLLLSSVLGHVVKPPVNSMKNSFANPRPPEDILTAAIASAARRVLDHCEDIAGLFTCGGDVTLSLCREIGATGMRMIKEVLPLAILGELTDGSGRTYRIVTKGGMIGEDSGMLVCINHLFS